MSLVLSRMMSGGPISGLLHDMKVLRQTCSNGSIIVVLYMDSESHGLS